MSNWVTLPNGKAALDKRIKQYQKALKYIK